MSMCHTEMDTVPGVGKGSVSVYMYDGQCWKLSTNVCVYLYTDVHVHKISDVMKSKTALVPHTLEVREGDVLAATPRLAQLKVMRTPDGQKVEIIKGVASRWKDIGILLDFDATGKTLDRIQADMIHQGVVSCCQSMFQYWLQGNGVQPVTWSKLLEVLEDNDCGTLATDVKKVLCNMSPGKV